MICPSDMDMGNLSDVVREYIFDLERENRILRLTLEKISIDDKKGYYGLEAEKTLKFC